MNLISKNKITFIFLFSIFLLPAYGANKDTKAIYELIERVTPGYSSQYRLEIIAPDNGVDVYEVDGNGKEIILRGNTPVALATAFNWYLKYTCQAHVSWFGNQLNLPEKLPQPRERERRVINGRYRVYMNYCTVSYTAAWWDWERWQKELDFMAMNSVNMPLFTIGLDAVWYNTLL
ncbi:alpha-N-acetylglucosaminidase, partial [Bacteroides salyersiae]